MLELSHSGPFVEAVVDLVGDVQEVTRSGGYILCPLWPLWFDAVDRYNGSALMR